MPRSKEKNREAMRKWRAENPEKAKARSREWARKRREQDPEGERAAMFAARYGMTKVEAQRVLATKLDTCEVCGKSQDETRIEYDHCHTHLWLCRKCNIGLGHFDDNPVLLRAAADYLESRTQCQ